jgi:hypothetical protein
MKRANFSMVKLLLGLTIALLSCGFPIAIQTNGADEAVSETESWQSEVDAIKAMTRGQPIPGFLLEPDASQDGEVFDPNQLLVPLDHLSLQPGVVLDFVYRYDGIGGKPILYARQPADQAFENYPVYAESKASETSYLDTIRTDGTEAGYFQWVLLNMMGDQFYLYWHSGYHDAEITASRARLEALVSEMRTTEFGETFTNDQARQALKIDPAPIVEVGNELVMVRVVWFTKWGGFYESIYLLGQSTPHQVMDLNTKNLLEYDCAILY